MKQVLLFLILLIVILTGCTYNKKDIYNDKLSEKLLAYYENKDEFECNYLNKFCFSSIELDTVNYPKACNVELKTAVLYLEFKVYYWINK